MNTKFKTLIATQMNGKISKYPNSLNKPFYYNTGRNTKNLTHTITEIPLNLC